MLAKSIFEKSPEGLKTTLEGFQSSGYEPTLAFAFISVKEDIHGYQKVFDSFKIKVFGVSAGTGFVGHEISDTGANILLLDIKENYFKLLFDELESEKEFNVAEKLGHIAMETFSNPAILMSASHIETYGPSIIEGFQQVIGKNVTLIGGMASDDAMDNHDFVFCNHKMSYRGLVVLVFDLDKIDVQGEAVSGWRPMGVEKTITKAEGTWVYTIDDKPAMGIFEKFLGYDTSSDGSENMYKKLGNYPLQFNREGVPLLLPAIFCDKTTEAVMLGRAMPEGSVFKFSLPPDFDMINTVVERARKIRDSGYENADAMVVFSCIGRLMSFGPMVKDELKGIQEIWNAPMAGFFSYGEFGKAEGESCNFHGVTCSWVILKEK